MDGKQQNSTISLTGLGRSRRRLTISRFGTLLNILFASVMFASVMLAGAFVSSASAQESFPYEATVATTHAVVHAAPSDRAYSTATLPRGTRIEVYRHDPGGWCAIRPPQGSFSLIARDALRPTSDPNVAELVRGGVKAWVGTRITHRSEPLWQVKLSEGELVELLIPWNEQAADEEWVLMAPPAGEFRWVHQRELHKEAAPATVVVPHAPESAPQTDITAAEIPSQPTSATPSHSEVSADPAADPSSPSAAESNSSQGWTNSQNQPTPNNINAGNTDNGSNTNSAPPAVSNEAGTAATNSALPMDFASQFSAAERAFDRVLSARTAEAEQALASALSNLETLGTSPAVTAADKESLERLVSRVEKWQSLELRRQALERIAVRQPGQEQEPGRLSADPSTFTPIDSAAGATGATSSASSGSSEGNISDASSLASGGGRWRSRSDTIDPLTTPTSATDATYASSGTLSRLIRTGGQASSSYAIQDDRGRVIALVVPTAGLNLERYLKKEVGVIGATSRNPTLNLPTVIAERVVELDRHR